MSHCIAVPWKTSDFVVPTQRFQQLITDLQGKTLCFIVILETAEERVGKEEQWKKSNGTVEVED